MADLDRIAVFNRDRSEAWAQAVQKRLVDRCETLAAHPLQGRAVGGSVRRLSVPDIQYSVSYRVDAEAVIIVRVHHTREHRDVP